MEKYIKHFITISKHKWYVAIECFRRGMIWQGITHDLSKYSFIEFFTSAKYFQGTGSPIDAEKKEKGYSIAWLNHKAKNKHHWIYWTDRKDGKEIAVPMPEKYIQEMLCDFIGAGKAYSKDKWTSRSPLEFYLKGEKDRMFLHPETKKRFEELLNDLFQQSLN